MYLGICVRSVHEILPFPLGVFFLFLVFFFLISSRLVVLLHSFGVGKKVLGVLNDILPSDFSLFGMIFFHFSCEKINLRTPKLKEHCWWLCQFRDKEGSANKSGILLSRWKHYPLWSILISIIVCRYSIK